MSDERKSTKQIVEDAKRSEETQSLGDIIGNLDKYLGIVAREQRQCGDHGEYESSLITRGEVESWTGCPQCSLERQKRNDHERIARERREAIAERQRGLLGYADIPERFETSSFDDYEVEPDNRRQANNLQRCREYAEEFPRLKDNGVSLILMGNVGTGKTHLATAIAQHVIRTHDMRVHYVKAAKLFRRVKDTYGKQGESEGEVIGQYAKMPLLIIDEIGLSFGSETELNILSEIIDERYERRLPLLIVTNIDTKEELEKWLGKRAYDRLTENGRALLFDWESHRRKMGGS